MAVRQQSQADSVAVDDASTLSVPIRRSSDDDAESFRHTQDVLKPFRLDNPFPVGDVAEIRSIGRRIACQYNLLRLTKLFETAALLVQDPHRYDVVPPADDDPSNQSLHRTVTSRTTATEFQTAPPLRRRSRVDVDMWDLRHQETERTHTQDNEGITEDEKVILANEKKRTFWDQPPAFRVTCYMLFTAAVVQGWIQTSMNGAVICFLDPLIDPNPSTSNPPELDQYGCYKGAKYEAIYGVINAVPFLFGPVGCLTVDWLNEKLMGRRRAIIVSTLFIFGMAIASAFMTTWWGLLICRIFLGIGMGGKAAVVPVFLAEIAPAHIRAMTIMNWQVFDALGNALGFSANLLASLAERHTIWRWQAVSTVIPSFALLIGLLLIPWDSPRFEMKNEGKTFNRYYNKRKDWNKLKDDKKKDTTTRHDDETDSTTQQDLNVPWFGKRFYDAVRYFYGPNPEFEYQSKAFNTLKILRGNDLLAAKELVYTHCQLIIQKPSVDRDQSEQDDIDFAIKPLSYRDRLRHLFDRNSYLSRELTATTIVMIAQQTSGVNLLVFYSVKLLTPMVVTGAPATASLKDTLHREPLWFSWGLFIANFVFAIPAYSSIQSRGRRWLVLTSMPILSIMLALAAACLKAGPVVAQKGTVVTWTFLYIFAYSPGLGPVPFTLSAELFPLEYRMVGMSLVVTINFFVGGLFIFFVSFVPQEDESILLGAFAIVNTLVWFFVYKYVREPEVKPGEGGSTAGEVPLEAMYQIYDPPHSAHLEFQREQGWMSVFSLRKRQYFLNWYEERQESAQELQMNGFH